MTTAAECAGRIDSYDRAKRMEIDAEPAWMATLDNRTRDTHRLLDGETRDPKTGRFSNGCRYPGDPEGKPAEIWNCRCTLVAQIKGFEKDFSDMSWRNTYKMDGMSYEEWKKGHQKSTQQTPDFLMKKKDEFVSDEDEQKAFQIAVSAMLELPARALLKAGHFIVEAGYPNSACDWKNKTIRMGISPTKAEFKHEVGHIIEHYGLKANKVQEYKKWLVEGLTLNDIYTDVRYRDNGEPVLVFLLRGKRFESDYQSRLYVSDPDDAINSDGSINTDCMWECVSEAFQKVVDGGNISEKAYDLLKEVL